MRLLTNIDRVFSSYVNPIINLQISLLRSLAPFGLDGLHLEKLKVILRSFVGQILQLTYRANRIRIANAQRDMVCY